MQIHVRTDHHVSGREAVATHIEGLINGSLGRFSDQITRVEAHISDENGPGKGGGDDIRCVLEARVNGRPPMAVTNNAGTVHDSVAGAVDKMETMIATAIDKMKHA